jgi:hypothetical protein
MSLFLSCPAIPWAGIFNGTQVYAEKAGFTQIIKTPALWFGLIRENLRMRSIRFYLRTIAFDVEP